MAQDNPPQPGPLNPPALPATPPAGHLGTAANLPIINSTFPNPGSTWTPLGPAPLNEGGSASGRIAAVAVDPTNSSNIYVAAAGGGVWQSANGGSSWNPLTDNQASLAMGAIAIAPSNHLKIYAGTGEANNSLDSNFGQGILVSNDGGASWTLSAGPNNAFNRRAIGMISVDPTTDQVAYAAVGDFAENGLCCSGTGIYKTTDGGITWTNLTSATLDSLYPWSDVAVDPNAHNIVYAAHGDPFADNSANGVYRSTDSGATWSLLSGAPGGSGIGRIALAVAPSASTSGHHVLYVAIANTTSNGATLFEMLRSDNADAPTPTFTNLTSTPNFGGSGAQGWYDWIIAVDPANSANVYAAGALNYNNNSDNVIRSTNSGATWTDITTAGGIEPHTDCHGMSIDSSSRLLLGTDGGLWRYDPVARNWTNLNGNLNTIQFTGIGVHPTSYQTIIGGSQDNGTELSTGSAQWNATDGGDGGFSQISQTNPLIVYSVHPIGSFGSTAFLRVSTDGGNSFVSRTPTIGKSNLFNFYPPILVDPGNGNRVFLGGDALYESTTAGASWTTHTSPATTALNAIAVQPGGNTIYISAGGTASKIWVSTNDGASWTQHSLPLVGRVNELDVDPNDATGNTVVAVINQFNGTNGQVFRTATGGSTWTNISGNLPQVPTWSAKIDKDASRTIYVSNETGVYSSPSPYGNWSAVGNGLPHAQGVELELNSNLHFLAVATHGRGAWYAATGATTSSVPPSVVIDTPANGAVLSGATAITGWAIDNTTSVGTTIANVQVTVDGTVLGNATYGINRPDVCAAYPGRPGCPNVGFSYLLDPGVYAPGTHTITVSATDSDASPDTGTASITFTRSSAASPPVVSIDSPLTGSAVSGVINVAGWAIDNTTAIGSAISSVQVLVDGAVVGTATYGTSRPDVCAAYPGRPGCPNVGYTYSLNTSALTVGTHTLTVSATDSDTTADTGAKAITITVTASNGPVPVVFIDNPGSGAVVSGTIAASGWAIDNAISAGGTPIGSVQVKVDQIAVGNATYGTPRPDVCAAFPGRPNCPNVGWTYSLDTSTLTSGSHTLTVVAIDTDGNPDSGAWSTGFTVGPQISPLVSIDSPAAGSAGSGIVVVSGWAVDYSATGTGIANVQVKVDGTVVGNAIYGTARPDVCGVYPGRPGCPNVGYTYSLNTASLAAGSHTLTVSATDSDASPDTGSRSETITVTGSTGPPMVVIDNPAAGSVVSGTVTISGWAIDSATAIGSVLVKVDGVIVGIATYGIARTDVCAAYPGRPECPNVGYTFSLNASTLASGSHTIAVTATDTDAAPDSASASVVVTR
jgi:hypothetical protein